MSSSGRRQGRNFPLRAERLISRARNSRWWVDSSRWFGDSQGAGISDYRTARPGFLLTRSTPARGPWQLPAHTKRRCNWKAFFGRRGTLGNSCLNLASLITAAFARTSSGEIGRQVPSISHQASRSVKRTAFPSSMPKLMSGCLASGVVPEDARGALPHSLLFEALLSLQRRLAL